MADDPKEEFSELELKTLRELQKSGLSIQDIKHTVKALQRGNPNQQNDYRIGKSHVKYLLFGDTHIGHKKYDANLMTHAAKMAKKEKVDFAINGGDIMDGWYQNRPQSIFEQDCIGLDQQFNKTVQELGKLDVPLYFITGNHEYNTFMRGAGIEVGPYLEDKLTEKGLEVKFLGNAEGDIRLSTGTLLKTMHPDGGTAYALSYKPQKIVESFESGKKPNVLHIFHFHKAEYLYYRNIHTFQGATLLGQTKFMRGKQIPAHMGFWIIDLYTRSGGQVDRVIPQFFPSYK